MQKFLIKELSNTNIEKELSEIGFDKSYVKKAVDKFYYKNLKIFNLTVAQANVLKQTALSVGADCATHKNVITGQIEHSNCILGASLSQLRKICAKLEFQPFGLKELSNNILAKLITPQQEQTKIVGILNLTKNSFSDGGKYFEFDDAIKHLNQLIDDGADIIDIGAESTKPYSTAVSAETQLEKILPILEYISNNKINIPVSIDTRSNIVAQKCLNFSNVKYINDVSGFDYDKDMAKTIAKSNAYVIVQHSKGTPETMQNDTTYENLIDEIFINLKEKTDFALSQGINAERIIIDMGIGFGKSKEQNLEIINRWKEFKSLGYPIMLGISRKSFLGLENCSNEEKDIQTLAFNAELIKEKIDYIRVHNVKIHKTFKYILG